MSMARKFNRSHHTDITIDEAFSASIVITAAMAAEIVQNNYGKLRKKETRASVMVELLLEALTTIDKPSPFRQNIQKELAKHVKPKRTAIRPY